MKINIPGIPQVRRYANEHGFIADMIYDELLGVQHEAVIVDLADPTRHKRIPPDTAYELLLTPIFRGGKLIYQAPTLAETRQHTRQQLAHLHAGIKRLVNPHEYPAGLDMA